MQGSPLVSERLFNNPDSFAQCFDESWQRHRQQHPNQSVETSERLELILAQIADHPFMASDPARARQVAHFRIRLLDL